MAQKKTSAEGFNEILLYATVGFVSTALSHSHPERPVKTRATAENQ